MRFLDILGEYFGMSHPVAVESEGQRQTSNTENDLNMESLTGAADCVDADLHDK